MNLADVNSLLQKLVDQSARAARVRRKAHEEPDKNETIGMRVKRLRKKKGLTLDEVAHLTGIAPATLCRYEKGLRDPKLYAIEQLAAVLDTTPEYLLWNKNSFTASKNENNLEINMEKLLIHLFRLLSREQKLLMLECVWLFYTTLLKNPQAYPEVDLYADEFRKKSGSHKPPT